MGVIIDVPDEVYLRLEAALNKRAEIRGDEMMPIIRDEINALLVKDMEELEAEVGIVPEVMLEAT